MKCHCRILNFMEKEKEHYYRWPEQMLTQIWPGLEFFLITTEWPLVVTFSVVVCNLHWNLPPNLCLWTTLCWQLQSYTSSQIDQVSHQPLVSVLCLWSSWISYCLDPRMLCLLDFQFSWDTQLLQAVHCSGKFREHFGSNSFCEDFFNSHCDRHWPSVDVIVTFISKTLSMSLVLVK